MERKIAWEKYSQEEMEKVFTFAENYRQFLSLGKTERECVKTFVEKAKKAGFTSLKKAIKKEQKLKPGDKVYYDYMGKSLAMFVIGEAPISDGMNILGAHIDSPRLDLKQNPMYEDKDLVLIDTHY